MRNEPESVAIIGGGVIGAACAYYLSKAGAKVTIIESGKFGRGCSHANCGYVSPSHILPLTQPGIVSKSLKSMFHKDSPFRIKPRLNWELWSWLFRFWRRCNQRDMLAAGHAIQALLVSSRALFGELFHNETMDCDWETRGLLFVLHSQAGFDHFAEHDRMLNDEFGLSAISYEGDKVNTIEPALLPGLGGGWLYDCDAHLRSDKLMPELRRILEQQGVTILEGHEFQEFDETSGRVQTATLQSDKKSFKIGADAFVVATGAWTPLLKKALGCKTPIQPGKGYSITMNRPANCPKYPLILEEHRVAITPWASGYRIGSTMEFAGYDTTLNRTRLNLLRSSAHLYLHEPYAEPVTEEWYGWRPMTPDSIPIIDFVPNFDNVVVAAGHNMLGLSMATGTGKLVHELLTGQTPHVDPKPYSIRRF